jgi:predicted RNA binding protein YcfA (HicA-like mRNA interferase family)
LGRLRPLPFREIKRRLEKAGFVEMSQKGGHVKFVRRSADFVDTAIMPCKSEVPVGTLRSILSQAHVTLAEWETLGYVRCLEVSRDTLEENVR